MSRFKPGDQVVCTRKTHWFSMKLKKYDTGPKFNELVTINFVCNDGFLTLIEYPFNSAGDFDSFDPKYFQPLITDSQLEEDLKSIEKSKTIELV